MLGKLITGDGAKGTIYLIPGVITTCPLFLKKFLVKYRQTDHQGHTPNNRADSGQPVFVGLATETPAAALGCRCALFDCATLVQPHQPSVFMITTTPSSLPEQLWRTRRDPVQRQTDAEIVHRLSAQGKLQHLLDILMAVYRERQKDISGRVC